MKQSNGEILIETVHSWPGVSLESHRFGGIGFVVNGKEFGHIHGTHLVDLKLSKEARDEAIRLGKGMPHHVLPESNWVSVYLQKKTDVEHALELLWGIYEKLVSVRS